METIQAISLVIVLLAALFGCAQALTLLTEAWLVPKDKRLCLFLPLEGHVENVEQHIRAAQALAKRQKLRLLVVDAGTDDETRRIAQVLLQHGIGEWIEETDDTDLRDG